MIYGRSAERMGAFEDLLKSLTNGALPGVIVLFVLREDQKGALASLQSRKVLPMMHQEVNWKMVPSFTEQAARDFLTASGLSIPSTDMETIFQHVAEVEGTPGEVRAITVNIVGLILARTSLAHERRSLRDWSGGELVRRYVNQSLSRSELPREAPLVLRHMITERGTTDPKPISTIVKDTGLREDIALQCLTTLSGAGLVRRIDDEENIWDVSHDFIARILVETLPSRRPTLLQRLRVLVPHRKTWYLRYSKEQIRNPLPSGQFCIHLAAQQNDAVAIEYFAEQGADINARDGQKRTALHGAVLMKSRDVISILLEKAADQDARDTNGDTPLHDAATLGEPGAVSLLLNAKADLNAKNSDAKTPLHQAATNGHVSAVELLLQNSADVHVKDKYGDAALHDAAAHGHRDVVELLLSHDADIHVKSKYGATPLHKAAEAGHRDVVSLLLDSGANIDAKNQFDETPLHEAAGSGHGDVVAVLLDRGALVATRNHLGYTPLHEAAEKGHRNIVALLLEHRADIEAKDTYGHTSLQLAAQEGNQDIVTLLLKKKADIRARDYARNAVLHFVAIEGNRDVASICLSHGAEIDAQEQTGRTPLFYAASNDRAEIVSLLPAAGAKGAIGTTDTGETPLHVACRKGYYDIATLLARNTDVNAVDNEGRTPLHTAAAADRAPIVRLLLERGADPGAIDKEGKRPLEFGGPEIAALFHAARR